MRLSILLLFYLLASSVLAQPTLDWVYNYQTTGNDYGYGIDVDASGNTYWIGHNSNSNFDCVFGKLDPAGTSLWIKTISGSLDDDGYDIQLDIDGNIVITGYFSNTVDFDPGPGVVNLSSTASDSFVAKYDQNGNLIWAKKLGNGTPANSYSVKIDPSNNIIIGGAYTGTIDLDPSSSTDNHTSNGSTDVFIVKLNANGDYIWGKTYGNSNIDYYFDLSVDENGAVYIVTSYKGTEDFNPGSGTSNQTSNGSGANYDGAILKLTSSGSFSWVKLISTSVVDRVYDIECDQNGKVYYTGSFVADTDFNPNAGVDIRSTNGDLDLYIVSLNTDGSFNWVSTFGGTGQEDRPKIHFSQTNEVLVGAYFTGETDLNPTPTNDLYTAVDSRDILIVSYSESGNYNYGCVIGGTAIQDLRNISSDAIGGIYVVGMHNGTTDFDPGVGTQSITPLNYDAFVFKLNPCISQSISVDNNVLPSVQSECSVVSLSIPTATTSCGQTISGTHNVTLPITAQGTTVVTWTYDDGNGNTTSQTQNVEINDVTAPVADIVSLSDVTAECIVTSLTAPIATDNCVGSITGTHNVTLPITGQGTTVVTWTYDDGNGNTSTQTQNVVINDNTAPVADIVTLSDVTEECIVTTLTAPTATDNCSGTITGTHDVTLPIIMQGTTVVTWIYDDGNGNTSTQTQNVVINDITAPVPDISTLSSFSGECEVTPTAPTATDNCIGTITGTPDVSFPITTQGTTVVTWTYDDGNGNISTQTQDIIVSTINVGTLTAHTPTSFIISANASGYTYQWIENCGTTNDQIVGETNQTFTTTSNGTFAVIISNGVCSDTSDCIVIDELGVETIQLTDKINVYPNPTNGIVKITSEDAIKHYSMLNALGKTMVNQDVNSLTEAIIEITFEPGVYFIVVSTLNSEFIVKVVKE